MKYKTVIYEKQHYIGKITLNRPEKRNAMPFRGQGGLVDDLHAALSEAEDDDEIKVVVIKGAGPDFCAGHDLSTVGFVYGMKDKKGRVNQRVRYKVDRLHFDESLRRIFLYPKITIAQVHGHCLAEGLILVELCDMAIATEDAQFGHPEVWLGATGVSIIPILIMTIGLKRTMELTTTGRTIDGREAERIGLINKAVAADRLEEEVNKLAEKLARLPRDGIAIGKAARHLAYDTIGLTSSFTQTGIFHSWATNLHWEPDEHSFFKARRDKGVKEAYKERDAFIEAEQS